MKLEIYLYFILILIGIIFSLNIVRKLPSRFKYILMVMLLQEKKLIKYWGKKEGRYRRKKSVHKVTKLYSQPLLSIYECGIQKRADLLGTKRLQPWYPASSICSFASAFVFSKFHSPVKAKFPLDAWK